MVVGTADDLPRTLLQAPYALTVKAASMMTTALPNTAPFLKLNLQDHGLMVTTTRSLEFDLLPPPGPLVAPKAPN